MTVHFYNADFADSDGRKFHGTIFWDKHYPRRQTAQIAPYISEAEVDYASWDATAATGRRGLDTLIEKLKGRAKRMGLQLVSERETKFAPKASSVGQP